MKKIYTLVLFIISFFSGNAQIVDIPDANLKAKLLSASPSNNTASNQDPFYIIDLDFLQITNYGTIDTNGDGEIQVSEAAAIKCLKLDSSSIYNTTGLESFVNLRYLSIINNQLSSIDVSGFNSLNILRCSNNLLNTLNLTQNTYLNDLQCFGNQLIDLDLSQNIFLQRLTCQLNNLSTLDLSQNINLKYLETSSNPLTSLNISQNSSLKDLSCVNNNLVSLDVSANFNLESLICANNQITNFDLSNNSNLRYLNCNANLLTSLMLNNNTNLQHLTCGNNLLESLFIKKGNTNPLSSIYLINYIGVNFDLKYICADEVDLPLIFQHLNLYGLIGSCEVNSYCSFTPGGLFYSIQGNTKYDYNNDGCDNSDMNVSNLNYTISDGVNTGSLIANISGNYSIPVQGGSHTITPVLENLSYFNISPTSIAVVFPDEASPFTQDFCITPNGVKNDLEITIIPIEVARPGFNAQYKIIYKNKGNQVANGTLTFSFDDTIMDLISSIPSEDGSATNSFNWNFTDLNPFESREINLIFNINSPMETPAVNGDDILVYTATIVGVTDETPNDNTFTLNQTVVNSYDPNDKTCLEGNTISPEMVGEYLHYVIRFENTGTFAAENVVIADVIDAIKFEINTLIPQSSSHDFFTRINGNKVEFIFENINLPFDDENNDGYVAFKIKTKPNLVLGDELTNTANIYFDYNFPIITNTTSTTVEEPLSNQDFDFETNFTIFPNPAKDILNIKVKNEIDVKSISIYNTLGQIIMTTIHAENGEINVSNLQSGSYFIKVFTEKGNSTTKFIKQ